MLRRLYRCVVRLHPSSFRRRFGEEMLYIFDQQQGTRSALGLMLDGVFSLLRQWTVRPRTSIELSVAHLPSPTADHIPSFETLDAFRPRPSAIINGAVLSLILFCMTAFAIRYSWSHVLNLHILEIGTDWGQQVRPQESPSSQPARSRTSSGHSVWLQLDPYVGEYWSQSPPVKISVRIEDDHLALAVSGRASLALSPVSAKRFLIDADASNYVDFAADGQGRICCLSLVISGKVITAQRH